MDRDPCSRLGSDAKDAESIKEHPFFANIDWSKVLYREYHMPEPLLKDENMMSKLDYSKSIFSDLNLIDTSNQLRPGDMYGVDKINNNVH